MARPHLPKPPAPTTEPADARARDGAPPGNGPAAPSSTQLQPSSPSRVWKGETDEALAERASRGDGEAFEILVDRYQRVIFNLTLRMTGNWEDARELTQDVFVRTWRGLSGFDARLRFFSWIYRIAIHDCLNHRRRAGRQQALEGEPETRAPGPEGRLESLELETEVHDALGRLPEGDRQLLVLRHFLDHSYEEIAEVLRIPAKTVKSRLFAARQRLRGEFERRGLKP